MCVFYLKKILFIFQKMMFFRKPTQESNLQLSKTLHISWTTYIKWLFRGVNSNFSCFEKLILPYWAVIKTRKIQIFSEFWKKRETLIRNWQIPLIASFQNSKNLDFWSFWAPFKMPRFSILKLSPCTKTSIMWGG